VDVGERVDGHRRFDERPAAGQRPGREQLRRGRDAVDDTCLVGEDTSAVDAQAWVAPTVAAGEEHLGIGARRSAPRVEQLGRRVAAEHAPAPHQQVSRS
jgi:hypothetical protein